MSASSNILLKSIDFFLSPKNLVSVQSRMQARMVVFIFFFWAIIDVVGLLSALVARQSGAWIHGILIIVNLIFALFIKKAFSPEKVYFAYSSLFVVLQLLTVALMNYYHPILTRSAERAPVWMEFRVSMSK